MLRTSSLTRNQIFGLPDLETPIYSTDAFPFLPSHITNDFVPRRYAARESLAEIVVADLGDIVSKSPYVIVSSDIQTCTQRLAHSI
jgi:cleavage and polyadenylation specificity factor subunit 1